MSTLIKNVYNNDYSNFSNKFCAFVLNRQRVDGGYQKFVSEHAQNLLVNFTLVVINFFQSVVKMYNDNDDDDDDININYIKNS